MRVRGSCTRCGAVLHRETDPEGFNVIKCLNGHLLRYVSPDGEVAEAGVTASRTAMLSTREYVTDTLGAGYLPHVEALNEGTYGAWE